METEGIGMRHISYKKRKNLKYKRQLVSVSERNEDKECRTLVRKNFVYVVSSVPDTTMPLPPADIYIRKEFNTERKEERFSFRVKGALYTSRGRQYLKAEFCHSLQIQINWKTKNFSPKSVNLT